MARRITPDARPLGGPFLHFATVCLVLQHVSLPVPPALIDACTAFWAALGFRPVAPPPSLLGRARWLERGATQVHLLLEDGARPAPGGAHVAVVAPDYEAALAALGRLGVTVEPRAEHWGAPRAYAFDPVGHRVEVMARAPEPGPAPSDRAG